MTARKYKTVAIYILVYAVSYLAFTLLGPRTTRLPNFLLLGTAGIVARFMPILMVGVYVVSTTAVSEFTAAMQRLHLSEKNIIPLSVMFRFFSTVSDEFSSINAAMRMRDIRFGGKNAAKMIEYRLIPLMTCSVKIGEELSAVALTRGLGGTVKLLSSLQKRRTVFIITHDPELIVRCCTHMLHLEKGEVKESYALTGDSMEHLNAFFQR